MKLKSLIQTSLIALTLLTPAIAMNAENSPLNAATAIEISTSSSYQPGLNRVTFESEGETIVGNLYLPASYQPGDQLPAVVVAGSWTTVKEQMAGLYAEKLAEQGYAALAFDFRSFGESEGTPRNYESPTRKIADIRNAVTFLQTVDAVDSDRIAGLGICASAGYMAVATAEDDRIRSFIAIAPWIHDAELVNLIYGGEAAVQARIAQAEAARSRFEQTGTVDFVPAISTTNPDAAMFGEFDYYLNPDRGAIAAWSNQFAVMSWSEWLTFSAMPEAENIQVPTLFVHSEAAAIPDGAREFFEAIPTEEKQIVWLPEATQFDFYDQEATVNQAVSLAVEKLNDSFRKFRGAIERSLPKPRRFSRC